MNEPRERTVGVAGVSCRVWEQGDGEPIAFLAGVGGLPRWTPFLQRLARTRRVIAPSLPGFPGADAIGRLDDHLDWLLATHDLLAAAGAQGADLIGVSVGAALAADVAAVWPASARRLVLVSPLGLFDAADPSADIFAQPAAGLGALLCRDPAAFEAHVALPDGADPVEWTVQQVRAQAAAARLLWPVGDTHLARRLPRVTQPTLLVFGGADRVLPSGYRRRFQEALPQARLEVVAGAGHLVDLDAPQTLADLIDRFLHP
jgi:pimeloyl-ACP methyl ester carboxylesterase